MPSTVGGLVIFAAFLTPGFLNYIQRRGRVPQTTLSPLVEVATFLSISVATNIVAVGFFSFVRWLLPSHTPNVELLISQGTRYLDPRPGYIAVWCFGVLLVSCTLAVLVGRWPGPLFGRITPVIIDASAWYHVFDSAPKGYSVYVGCDLTDGTYVGGYLSWFNTDVDDSADRDLVLNAPIIVRAEGEQSESEFQRMILSARNISRVSVSYLKKAHDEEKAELEAPASATSS
jgi:Family of unknown function (DUF6338)